MSEVYRVVLRDTKNHDAHATREFDLPVGSTFPIGRASKNAAKQELMPSAQNAYIDSPVISREHAILSANASSGTPHVYLTDSASMHGTWLNNRRLTPHTPEQLATGDLLQFGVDVNRNEEFFSARHYRFESHLSAPYSLGYAVPDVESEDELAERTERRGSQQDPLVLDDSDSASEPSDDDQEVTVVQESVIKHEETVALAEQDSPVYSIYPESPSCDLVAEQDFFDDLGDEVMYNPDSDHEDVPETPRSDAASVDSSEADYISDPEVPDSEAEDAADVTIKDEGYKAREAQLPINLPIPPQTQLPNFSHASLQPRCPFSLEELSAETSTLPPLGSFGHTFDNNSFGDSSAPPLPPRPSAAKIAPWHATTFTAFGQPLHTQAWYSDDLSVPAETEPHNFGNRSICGYSLPESVPEPYASPDNFVFNSLPDPFKQPDRLQTPPPGPELDVTASSNPLPGRRTKVSIEEIVEDQPPTPTSIPSLKRKADALEMEDEPPIIPLDLGSREPLVTDESAPVDLAVAASTPEQTARVVAARPKKQPVSVLKRVRDAATYSLLGATGAIVAFTALSTLPDTFFV